MGISYYARTYEEGKKFGVADGFRALYCIFRYNAHRLPAIIQFAIYFFIGATCALVNLVLFSAMIYSGSELIASTVTSFVTAAALNYWLCIILLFRHKARWSAASEVAIYTAVVLTIGIFDVLTTSGLVALGINPIVSKGTASIAGLVFNFLGRRYLIFPESSRSSWEKQVR